jgi:dCMP deaminase
VVQKNNGSLDPFKATLLDDWSKKWSRRYLDMAALIASWSKDPSSKIGAVAVGDFGQILSTGYNGFPRNIKDLPERYENREEKYSHIIHAEMNTIYNASLTGVSLRGSTVYTHGLPTCSECAKGLIQAGVTRVVVRLEDIDRDERWRESWRRSFEMFDEAGVTVHIIGDED